MSRKAFAEVIFTILQDFRGKQGCGSGDNSHSSAPVIAAVGGGGKTAALFALARAASEEGISTAFTTTTHIRDPRRESVRRPYDRILMNSLWACVPDLNDSPDSKVPKMRLSSGALEILVSRELPQEEKLAGVEASWIPYFAHEYSMLLVEADGSKHLPIKAPADHEPVLPVEVDLVLGMVGLDCLDQPMNGNWVHRPELFGPRTHCSMEQPIGVEHIAALVSHPQGLFKSAHYKEEKRPLRLLILNKADLLGERKIEELKKYFVKAPEGVDLVLLVSVEEGWAEVLNL